MKRQETAIMAFRKSISQAELRAGQPEEQKGQQTTVYQPSRGGHFPPAKKPVPGTPKSQSNG